MKNQVSSHVSKASTNSPLARRLLGNGLLIAMLGIFVPLAHGENVQTTLQVVSIRQLDDNPAFYLQETAANDEKLEDPRKIEVSTNRLPKMIDYSGSSTCTLVMQDAEKGFKTVADLELLPDCARTIIVLAPATEDAKLPYTARVINATLTDFKPGTRRIINFSKNALRGETGAQPFTRGDKKNLLFQCEPGAMTDVPVIDPKAEPLASHPVILEYRILEDKAPETDEKSEADAPTDEKITEKAEAEPAEKPEASEEKPEASEGKAISSEDDKNDEAKVAEAKVAEAKVAEAKAADDKNWRTLSSTRWFYTPEQRHLIFVYFDEDRKTTVLHGLTESVQDE